MAASTFATLEEAEAWAKRKAVFGVACVVSASGEILATLKQANAETFAWAHPGSRVVPLNTGNTPAPSQGPSQMDIAAKLADINVVLLFAAARAIGFPVGRNGQHNKQSLIVALTEAGKGEAILAHLGKEAPQAPAPRPPAPPPAPSGDAGSAIERAIREIAGQSINADRVREIAREVADEAIAQAVESGAFASGPTYVQINIPGNEPIKLDRITHFQFPELMIRVSLRQDVLLVGPAGSGKTTVARDCADALSLPFYAISAIGFAHDLLGYNDAHGKLVRTLFREAFEKGGVFLLDDCFGSSPDALLALNMALANSHCAFPDAMIPRHPDFVCIIGDNSDGSGASMAYSGRARQDGAFLDRFTNIQWQIDPDIETAMCGGNVAWLHAVRAVREFAKGRGIQDVCATPRAVIRGAAALKAGLPAASVLKGELFRGALKDSWSLIEALPAVRQFLEAASSEF